MQGLGINNDNNLDIPQWVPRILGIWKRYDRNEIESHLYNHNLMSEHGNYPIAASISWNLSDDGCWCYCSIASARVTCTNPVNKRQQDELEVQDILLGNKPRVTSNEPAWMNRGGGTYHEGPKDPNTSVMIQEGKWRDKMKIQDLSDFHYRAEINSRWRGTDVWYYTLLQYKIRMPRIKKDLWNWDAPSCSNQIISSSLGLW